MTRAEWLALAERVEAATGADRELDAEIARAVGWQDVHRSAVDDSYVAGRPPGSTDWLYVPSFTYSLDAAAALVPEGWQINQLGEWESPRLRELGSWLCIVCKRGDRGAFNPCWDTRCNHAATAALALTAAACRAMAEEAGDE